MNTHNEQLTRREYLTTAAAFAALLLAPLATASSRHWKTPSRKIPMLG
jgi:hypothetical protein